MAARFELSKDKVGKFRFHLKAAHGEIIAASQAYDTKADAEKGIESIKKNAVPCDSYLTGCRRSALEGGATPPSWRGHGRCNHAHGSSDKPEVVAPANQGPLPDFRYSDTDSLTH